MRKMKMDQIIIGFIAGSASVILIPEIGKMLAGILGKTINYE
jgi:hypothetical protein